jgi:RimJ/RimL family protein N-acetyltransferase
VPFTARLLIEPLATEHAEGLLAALDHPSVGEYIGGPDVTTLAALRDRIDFVNRGPGPEYHPEQWFNAVVMLRDDRTIIGRIEATTYDEWAEIAYVFSPHASGAGYATEAVEWMIADLHQRGFCELWAAVHPDNAASLRLLARVGFAETDHLARPVGSYDEGDLILWRTSGTARQSLP